MEHRVPAVRMSLIYIIVFSLVSLKRPIFVEVVVIFAVLGLCLLSPNLMDRIESKER